MTKKQRNIYSKFIKFTDWMCIDIKRSMLCARANFLVAMGLLNYTEIIGGFLIGQYKKDKAGNIKYNKKGNPIETDAKDRFNCFFKYMGIEYEKLFNKELEAYSELRCGLTHEYLVKKKKFCVYNPSDPIDESNMDKISNPIKKNTIVKCGVIHYRNSWHFVNPKYFIDFKKALSKLKSEIEEGTNKVLLKNFFERANFINFSNFK